MKEKQSKYMTYQDGTEKKMLVQSMFNRIAARYDFLNHFLSLGIDNIWRKKTIRKMNIHSDSLILDLASGTGDLAVSAMKKKPSMIVGVDPARNMLKGAVKKKMLKKDYFAVEAFGENIPFEKETFSHAMIAYGIRNVSDREQTFREVARVLKSNSEGIFAVLEFSKSRSKLFSMAFDLYFKKILTFLGGIISRDKEAYRYLPESVEGFPAPEEFIKEGERNGFALIEKKEMFFGITTLYIFKKKSS